jgi:hypothetical protein
MTEWNIQRLIGAIRLRPAAAGLQRGLVREKASPKTRLS